MNNQADLLNSLRIASPCHIGWERMQGDDRIRFCDSCQRNVYNFADLTSDEINSLLQQTEGGICGKLYRRADGTILTRDCPVGLRAIRRRVARFAGAVLATLLSVFSVSFSQRPGYNRSTPQRVELKIDRSKTDKEKIGRFSGVVVDINGSVITNAEVSLRNPASNKKRVVFTDDSGVFTFTDVKDGRYMFKVSASGFKIVIADFVEVMADEYATTKVTMFVEQPESTIGFVIADPALESLRGAMIRKLPINN